MNLYLNQCLLEFVIISFIHMTFMFYSGWYCWEKLDAYHSYGIKVEIEPRPSWRHAQVVHSGSFLADNVRKVRESLVHFPAVKKFNCCFHLSKSISCFQTFSKIVGATLKPHFPLVYWVFTTSLRSSLNFQLASCGTPCYTYESKLLNTNQRWLSQ